MSGESIRAVLWALLVTAALAAAIKLGSRDLAHFDAALVGYTFATLFAAFGIAYRYAMWLQRPPTRLYWRRGFQMFFRRRFIGRNLVTGARRFVSAFALQGFIWRRGAGRGLAHWLILWGCVIGALITFPLVFGWFHLAAPADDFGRYIAYVFGVPTISFAVDGVLGFVIFHGLVWASLLVIPGVMLAMRRRMSDRGEMPTQRFETDLMPLVLLFAISVTGLMLTASYTWMRGYAYDFLAIVHAVTVIFTLLWLPFGKLFHIFQRPAQLGVAFYKDVGRQGEQALCARCGDPYASRMQVEDLIEVERRLGYRYEMAAAPGGGGPDHYQRICPRCRRSMLAIAQSRTWLDALDVQRDGGVDGTTAARRVHPSMEVVWDAGCLDAAVAAAATSAAAVAGAPPGGSAGPHAGPPDPSPRTPS